MAGIRPYLLLAAVLVGATLFVAWFLQDRGEPVEPGESTVDALPFSPVELDTPTPAPDPGGGRDSRHRALQWLASRQREDGSWEGPLRRTGLAVLAFLSCGETHQHGRYRRKMRDAIRFLHESQGEDGVFRPAGASSTGLDQVITTLAVVDGYGLTSSPLFKRMAVPALGALSRMESIDERSKPWVSLIFGHPPIDAETLPSKPDLHSWYTPTTTTHDSPTHAAGVLCLAAVKTEPAPRQRLHRSWPRFLAGMGQCFTPRYLYFGSVAIFKSRDAPGTAWSDQLRAWQDRHQQGDGSFLPDPQTPADLGRVGATALMVMARSVTESYNFHVIEDRPR